jgi:hypothetical protein
MSKEIAIWNDLNVDIFQSEPEIKCCSKQKQEEGNLFFSTEVGEALMKVTEIIFISVNTLPMVLRKEWLPI